MQGESTVVLVADVVPDIEIQQLRSVFDADNPSQSEVQAIVGWLESAGYRVEVEETVQGFVRNPARYLGATVFPLWRGGASRNRTAVIPAVCEVSEIRYVGGDTFVQTVCQDKSLSKVVARAAGLESPRELVLRDVRGVSTCQPSRTLQGPFVLKPLYSAASIGISASSFCHSDREVQDRATQLFREGLGPLICEEFIAGDEVSICLLEEQGGITASCVAAYRDASDNCPFSDRLFTFEDKMQDVPPWKVVALAPLSTMIQAAIESVVRQLGKLDYLRIDGKMRDGRFVMIELTPDIHLGRETAFLAAFAATGIPPAQILDTIIQASLRNHTATQVINHRASV